MEGECSAIGPVISLLVVLGFAVFLAYKLRWRLYRLPKTPSSDSSAGGGSKGRVSTQIK